MLYKCCMVKYRLNLRRWSSLLGLEPQALCGHLITEGGQVGWFFEKGFDQEAVVTSSGRRAEVSFAALVVPCD